MTCHMLFMRAPTPHLEGFGLEQCQKLMVSRIKQIPSVSFERGEGGVEKACILPALAAPSWFHLIVGEPLGANMILVVWRHAQYMIETHFWIPHPRFTFALIPRLGLVAINRGGLDHPAGTCWLANPPHPTPAPNAMSETCHNNQTLRLINMIKISLNSFSQRIYEK